MRLTGRERLGIGTLALLAIAILIVVDGGPAGPKRTGPRVPAAGLGPPPVIHLDRLGGVAVVVDPGARNPFDYRRRAAVDRGRAAGGHRSTRDRVATGGPAPVVSTRAAGEIGPARPPTPSFEYIGSLGPKDDRYAVFETAAGVVVVRAGERVDREFAVTAVRRDRAILTRTGGRHAGTTAVVRRATGPS